MEAVKPYDVALCTLLRSYLCPLEDGPPPDSPLHAAFGEALLREIRRRGEAANPSLIELLHRVQVNGQWAMCWRRAVGSLVDPLLPFMHAYAPLNSHPAPLAHPPTHTSPKQDHLCPIGDELSAEAEYFGVVKAAAGQRLAALESPDDLVGFFGALAEGVITSCTSAPPEGAGEQGADASSAMGLYLRMVYARYTAMPFEVGGWVCWEGLGAGAGVESNAMCKKKHSQVWPGCLHRHHRCTYIYTHTDLSARRPSASCWARCKPTLTQRLRCCRAHQSRPPIHPPCAPCPSWSAS